MNVVLVAPAATVVLVGTVAVAVLLLDRDTTIPPVGAGAVKLTVPVEGEPPTTVAGLTPTELSLVADWGGDTEVVLPDPPHEFNAITTVNSPKLDMNADRSLVLRNNFIAVTPSPSQIAYSNVQLRLLNSQNGPPVLRVSVCTAALARPIVRTATVTVALFVPSSVTAGGVIRHVAESGKPPQLRVTD